MTSAAPTNTSAISNTPQAKDDVFATVEGGGLISIAGLMANDAGGNGKSFYGLYGSTTTSWGAKLTVENGAIRYDGSGASRLQSLAVGQTVTDTFQYAIQLGKGVISIATVTVTLTGSNDGPVAVADFASMSENQLLVIDALANDIDIDSGAVKSLVSVTAPKGTATIEANKIRFDPGTAFDHLAQGATETVRLTYAMADEHGGRSESTVTITVTGTNDGPVAGADLAAGTENQALTIDVLANDSDVDDGAVLTVVSASASKGEVAVVGNKLSFAPGTAFDALAAGATETVTLSYAIADEHGATTSSTVTVTVTGTNDAPVAVADTASTRENAVLAIDALANDTDVDAGATRSLVEASVSKGEVRIADGQVVFDPGTAFDGLALGATEQVTIGYTIADEHGALSASTITVTVTGTNDGPVAVADAAAGSENQALVIDVLANDTDVDAGAVLTLVSVSSPRGDAAIVDGAIMFHPGTAFDGLAVGEQAQVTLTYVVADEHGASASSTVTVTVTGTNDAPVAVADIATTSENQTLTVDVLANDTDVDGALRTLLSVDAPKGTASIVDGAVVFDPGAAFDALAVGQSEEVAVSYTIADEHGAQASSTLTITVTGSNDGPVVTSAAADAAGTVVEAGSENAGGTPSVAGVLSSSDVDQGSSATWSGDTAGSYGSFAIGADGGWTYTLDNDSAATQALVEGEVVTETFTATVTDEHGATATQVVTIEVTGAIDNRAPTAAAVQVAASEDGPTIVASFIGDDIDADDDAATLSYELLSGPAAGVVTDNGDGTFAFDAAGDFEDLAVGQSRDVSFSYRSIDRHGAVSAPATVTVTVTGSNDGPVVTSGPATGTVIEAGALDDRSLVAGTPTVGGTLTATDADNSAVLTWTGSANGTYGSFALGANGVWTFTLDNSRAATQGLNEGQTVTETFTARVADQQGAFVTRPVTITITGTNDAPTVADVTLTGGSTTTGGFVIGNTVVFGLTDNNGDGRPETGVSATTVQLGGGNNGSLARDIDGDGDVDVVTSTGNGAIVYTNRGDINGDGRIDFSAFTIAGASNSFDVAVADLNGDGRLDIALGNGNGTLFEALNLGDTNSNGLIDNFVARTTGTATGSNTNYGIVSGDLNGDGRADLVQSAYSSGPTVIRYNLGDTNGDGQLDYRVQTLAGSEGLGVAIGDVDGDGRMDILQSRWSNQNETLYLNRGDADGDGQVTYQAVTLATGGSTMEGQFADIDRDGDLDILLPSQSAGTVTIGYNRGDTTGDGVPDFTYQTVAAPLSWGLAAGDIDGDGDVDILMSGSPATYLSNKGDANGDGILEFTSVTLANVAGGGSWDAEFLVQGTGAGAREDGPAVAGTFKGDDVDGDDSPATLTYQILTQPSEGSVAGNGGPGFSFHPGDDFQDLAAGESRVVTFTYRTIDAHGAASAPAIVTVTVAGTNDAPTIVGAATTATATIIEIADGAAGENATTRTAAGSIGFADLDTSDIHGASFLPQASGYLGTLTLGAVGQAANAVGWSFAVADSALDMLGAGQSRTQNYTVTVADGKGGSVNQSVTVTLTGTNDAPTAAADSATISENQTITINVLANDTDVDLGDTKTLTAASSPLGTVSIVNNQIQFVPGTEFDRLGAGQSETVVISYTMRDTAGSTSSSTVTLRVNGVNDAPSNVVLAGAPLPEDAAAGTVVGALVGTDVDNATLVYTAIGGRTDLFEIVGDQVRLKAGAEIDYDAVSSHLLSVRATDASGAVVVRDLTIEVANVNEAPVWNIAINGDFERGPFVNNGSGWMTLLTDSQVIPGWSVTGQGIDWHIADDTQGRLFLDLSSSTAGGVRQDVTTVAGGVYRIDFEMAGNPAFQDAANLVKTLQVSALDGGAALASQVYSFNVAGKSLTDMGWTDHSMTFTAADASTTLAFVSQTNSPVGPALDNVALTLIGFATAEDSPLSSSVRATDPDGDALTYSLATAAANGSVVVNADGSFTYTPNADFAGNDSFDVRVSDGSISTVKTFNVAVTPQNDAPTAVADSASGGENQLLTIDVLANDSDPDAGDSKSLVSVAAPKGTASIVAGQLQFQPGTAFDGLAAGETEEVVLSYTMRDAAGLASSSTVTVTVAGANDAPTIVGAATDAAGAIAELAVSAPGANSATLSDTGSIRFADVDLTDTHAASFTPQAAGFLGSFTLGAIDQATNQLGWNFSVADAALNSLLAGETRTQTYNVTLDDGHGGLVAQAVTIIITGAADNVAPVAGADAVTLNEDTPITFDVRVNDTDADGDALTVTQIGGTSIAVNGSVAVAGGAVRLNPNGSLSFTPSANFNGTPSFGYTLSDGKGGTAVGTVNLTVVAVNDAPQNSAPASRSGSEDTAIGFTGANAVSVTDIDGGSLTTTLTATNGTLNVATGGTAAISGNGSASVQLLGSAAEINAALAGLGYQPTANFNGAATLTVSTSDGQLADTDTINLTVTAVNDAPANLVLSNATVAEGIPGAVVGVLSADNVDPGDVFSYSIRAGLDAAKFTIVGNELRVTSTALDFETAASHSLIVRVTDSAGQFVDRTFTVVVEDRNEITLTPGTDVIASPATADVVIATATTLGAADQLNAGAGSDSLLLFNGGSFDLRAVSQFSGFEEVRLINFATDSQTLFLRSEAATVSGAGNGSRVIHLNSGQVSYSGGDGSDQLQVNSLGNTAWNKLNSLNGGNGFDTLTVNAGVGTTDLSQAAIVNFESLSVIGAANVVRVDGDTLTNVTSISGTSGARIVTGVAELDLSGKSVTGVLFASDNATGTLFKVNNAQTASSILGGAGLQDTIQAVGFNFTADQRAAIFAVSSVEKIVDGNGAVTMAPPADPSVVKLTTANDVVNGDLAPLPASITVNTTAATLNVGDQLSGGATGTDSLALYGPGTFSLRPAHLSGFESIKTINFGNETQVIQVQATDALSIEVTGTGSQQTFINSGLLSYAGGAGNDQIYANWIVSNGWNVGNVLAGGAGSDNFVINLSPGAAVDLTQASFSSFETVNLSGSGTAKVDADMLSDVTQIVGSSFARLSTDAALLNLTGKTVSTIAVVSENATGTTFRVSNANSAAAIYGGAGANDSIEAVGFSLTADQRSAIFAVSSIESITNGDGTVYTAPAADPAVVKLGLGADTVAGDQAGVPASLTVNASGTTLGSADQISGGVTGTDVLALYGGGSIDLRTPALLTGFEEIRIRHSGSDFQSLFLRNEPSNIIVDGGGNRQVYLNAAQTNFAGGSGVDYIYVNQQSPTSWNAANQLNGGANFDWLIVSQGSVDLTQATIAAFEGLQVNGASTVVRVDAELIADFTQITGSTGAKVITGDAVLDLTGKSVSAVQVSSDNAAGTLFKVNSSSSAFTIAGGVSSNDVIEAAGFSFTADQRTAIFAGGGVEVISDTTGIYGNAGANVLTAKAAGSSLFGGAGNDQLNSGAGNDAMSGGSGNDRYVFDLAAARDVIKDFQGGPAGDDIIDLSALKGVTNDNGHIQDFADLLANHATELNGSTVISWGAANTITIEGVSVASLTATDFVFG